MKLLIIRVSAIGDVIHTFPALFYLKKGIALHQSIPNASSGMIPPTVSWVVQEKAASLLIDQPFIDDLHILPNGFLKPKNWRKTKTIIKKLRDQQWDAIIDFQGLLKTSFVIWWLKGQKFGFDKNNTREKFSTLFTHHHTTPTYTNIIQKNLALASDVISHLISPKTCPTLSQLQDDFELFIPKQKREMVDGWLKKHRLKSFVTLAPNTTWPSKHWPLKHWQELARLLIKAGTNVVLAGKDYGPAAAQLAHHIEQTKLPVPLAPAWDLLTVAYLLQKTDLLIAPDTGLLHLADFLGTKTIGLFGPTLVSKHGPFLTKENIANAVQIPCPHRYKKQHEDTDCMARVGADVIAQFITYPQN